jgi:membrane protease YdiL (CAAX protease family)
MPFTVTILATLLLYVWVLEPMGVPVALPGAVLLAATILNNVVSGEWGLSPRALLPASRATAFFTLPAVLVVLGVGFAIGTLHDRTDFLGNFAGLIPWATAQQWMLQTVVLREVRRRLPPRAAVVVGAMLFAVVHAPNVFLMAMTGIGALGWCAIYARHPNFLPLGVSHALATLALLYAFDDDITGRLRIGESYLRLRP